MSEYVNNLKIIFLPFWGVEITINLTTKHATSFHTVLEKNISCKELMDKISIGIAKSNKLRAHSVLGSYTTIWIWILQDKLNKKSMFSSSF